MSHPPGTWPKNKTIRLRHSSFPNDETIYRAYSDSDQLDESASKNLVAQLTRHLLFFPYI